MEDHETPLPKPEMSQLSETERNAIEAATFRRLVEHLRNRTDVQNIDLMNLAGFCRNCLAKWFRAAATDRGVALDDPTARELIYGMPYDVWKDKHQLPTPSKDGTHPA